MFDPTLHLMRSRSSASFAGVGAGNVRRVVRPALRGGRGDLGLKWSHPASKCDHLAVNGTNTKSQWSFPAAKRAGTDLNGALFATKGIDPRLKRTEMELNRGGLDLNCSATQLKEDETELKRGG